MPLLDRTVRPRAYSLRKNPRYLLARGDVIGKAGSGLVAEEQGCLAWLEPRRAQGVHDLMVRLLGKCTCEGVPAEVIELYVVDGARSAEMVSA